MEILVLYILAILSFLVWYPTVFFALNEKIDIKYCYYHYRIRKPLNWLIFFIILINTCLIYKQHNHLPSWVILPILISIISLIFTYKLHQDTVFDAVDFPKMTTEFSLLPLEDSMEIAVIEYGGITKCYPLNYVIHHHIVNDKFGEKTVALTYCAMCRTIIPFDVTDIGPLFVGFFKNSNMVVADRKTKTFFQQATCNSMIGKLHPSSLKMIPFQILPWKEVKQLHRKMEIVYVSSKDLKEFQLPIPGIWQKILNSEITPGLSAINRNKEFKARTRVIGILLQYQGKYPAYLKDELLSSKIIKNKEFNIFLINVNGCFNAFKNYLNNFSELTLQIEGSLIIDTQMDCKWDMQGKILSGSLTDLIAVPLSDEYWFSWKRFHPNTSIMHVEQ